MPRAKVPPGDRRGLRTYVVDGDLVTKVPERVVDAWMQGKPGPAKFINRPVYIATAYYTLRDGKPRDLVRIDYALLKMGADGRIDAEQRNKDMELAVRVMESRARQKDVVRAMNVIIAGERFDERQRKHRHPEIPARIYKAIHEDLFGRAE